MRFYFAWGYDRLSIAALQTYPWPAGECSLLVSFPFVHTFRWPEHVRPPDRLMLDSGAFSVWKSGHTIDMSALVAEARQPRWTHAVGLDVIGDPEATRVNVDAMQAAGCSVMPVFHYGEPLDYLVDYCSRFEYVGLSCRFGETMRESRRWLDDCYRRCYPHRFHSFGWTTESILMHWPFYSADSSTWNKLLRWGDARAFNGQWLRMRTEEIRGASANVIIHSQIRTFLDMNRRVTDRWQSEMSRRGWRT